MQHMQKKAFAHAIEFKGEEDDPVSIVTKSLEDLQKAVDDRLKKLEEKGGTPSDDKELKALQDRLAELEKKTNRPDSGDKKSEPSEERKAFATYLRGQEDRFAQVVTCLTRHELPCLPGEVGLSQDQFTAAVLAAPETRPDRYTILEHLAMDDGLAAERVVDFVTAVEQVRTGVR